MVVKSVEYAYPTSPHAEKWGFGKSGCYTVQQGEQTLPKVVIAAYTEQADAIAHAERLELPWSRYTIR